MTYTKLPGTNGAGSQVTVTNTATSLLDLIRTASGNSSFVFKGENYIVIAIPEGSVSSIRYFLDGNTPTASVGSLLNVSDSKTVYAVKMNQVSMISTGGSTLVNVSIGIFGAGQPSDDTSLSGSVISAEITDAILGTAGLVPVGYDFFINTYVTSGNGIGELETITYKTGGSGGTTVRTLTFTYDANDQLETATSV